jgi:parallel beta-helix repeat protein
MHARGIPFATLLLLALAAAPVLATTAVVPDSFPTIQAGIDSGRDTVLVRGGHYDENLTGDQLYSSLTLLAYPPSDHYDDTELPQVGSLTFPGFSEPCPIDVVCGSSDLLVRGFRFRGKVAVNSASSGNSSVAFETCRMDSGLSVGTYVYTARVSGCTILGELYANTMAADITLNSVYGGGIKVFGNDDYTIRGNHVYGPADYGIWAWSNPGGHVDSNTVTGVDVGVFVLGGFGGVRGNSVTECSGSGIVARDNDDCVIEGNLVQNCGGYGIDAAYNTVNWNTVLACQSGGLRLLDISSGPMGNVVGRCGGPGIEVSDYAADVERNTCYLNAGPGFSISTSNTHISNNIAYGNAGPGLLWTGSGAPTLACNDWYGNIGGMVSGALPGLTDISAHPLFCDLLSDDVHLSAGSPLLSLGACGLVGALGEGCTDPVGVPPSSEMVVRAFTVSPNPSRGAVHFSWASSDRPERLDVYDVTGARRWSSSITEGASTLQWPSIDREGARLPAGIYYARLTSRGTSAIARFVLVQ